MRLLYFAWLRQHVGRSEEVLDLPHSISNVAELVEWLGTRGEGYARAFADQNRVRVAINQVHSNFGSPVANHDEVAFFPPVTGG